MEFADNGFFRVRDPTTATPSVLLPHCSLLFACTLSLPNPMTSPTANQHNRGPSPALQVKYGVNGLATPGETYALTFAPAQPPASKLQLFADPSRPGCYLYRVSSGREREVKGGGCMPIRARVYHTGRMRQPGAGAAALGAACRGSGACGVAVTALGYLLWFFFVSRHRCRLALRTTLQEWPTSLVSNWVRGAQRRRCSVWQCE